MRRFLIPVLLALALPAAVRAQWEATPQVGYVFFDEASTLKGMPMAGMDLAREVGDRLSIGLTLAYARGELDGSMFPPVQLDFGPDSTVYATINQSLSVLNYGLRAEASLPLGALRPYVAVGAGASTMFLNAQQWDRPARRSGTMFSLGAGMRLAGPAGLTLVLDARDAIYPGFDPNELNVVREKSRNDRFPELNPPPLEEGTMHNLRLALGFQFRPGGGR